MSIEYLNTFCVEAFLCLTSNYDLCTFGKEFPVHKEAVEDAWRRRPEIYLDDLTFRKADKLLQIIKCHTKLKKVSLKRKRMDKKFYSNLIAAIAANCDNLEVLDMPALTLNMENVSLLESCVSLKYLDIKYERECKYLVETLIKNNCDLESIYLTGGVTSNLLNYIPKTIKALDIYPLEGHLDSFLTHSQTWRLEELSLLELLDPEDILQLSTQTTLKYLYIRCREDNDALEVLFRNNPKLEEVHIDCYHDLTQNGACLRYLPPTLKCLRLEGFNMMNFNVFLDYVKTWKLQTFQIKYNDEINSIIPLLEAAPSLCEFYSNMNIVPDIDYINFEQLAQLKVLHIALDFIGIIDFIITLLQNCVNLEDLKMITWCMQREIMPVVGQLSKLKHLFISDKYATTTAKDVNNVYEISKCKLLTTIKFKHCYYIPREDLLTLIRECKHLTNLFVSTCSYNFHTIDKRFLKDVVEVLKQQTNRKEVLTLQILDCSIYKVSISTKTRHPLLNLEVIPALCKLNHYAKK